MGLRRARPELPVDTAALARYPIGKLWAPESPEGAAVFSGDQRLQPRPLRIRQITWKPVA